VQIVLDKGSLPELGRSMSGQGSLHVFLRSRQGPPPNIRSFGLDSACPNRIVDESVAPSSASVLAACERERRSVPRGYKFSRRK